MMNCGCIVRAKLMHLVSFIILLSVVQTVLLFTLNFNRHVLPDAKRSLLEIGVGNETVAWRRFLCRWLVHCKCVIQPGETENRTLSLTEDTTNYFVRLGNITCFREGIRKMSAPPDGSRMSSCPCRQGWGGRHCSIPDEVMRSNLPTRILDEKVKARIGLPPRKIIQAFPFNNEFEILEARLAELDPVVDVFLILESNYTASGHPRPLMLLDKLNAGHYKEYGCKIVHVLLDYFPVAAQKNGWIADNLLRNHLAKQGLMKQLKNFTGDDLFLMTDADELPYRSTLWFLRLHDGYPQPIGYFLKTHVFGFFWRSSKETVHVVCGVTVSLLTQVLENNAIQIRSAPHYLKKHAANLNSYIKSHPQSNTNLWSFGNKSNPAGWHCSWCCREDCIRTKLISAQNGDSPRWGDYPAKTNVTYISKLIETGTWFDNVSRFKACDNIHSANFAPSYTLANFDRYRHILVNPKKLVSRNSKTVH